MKAILLVLTIVVSACSGRAPLPSVSAPPQLPDSAGWGVHVLALARAPDSALWVGTYGEGIFVLRPGASAWERIRSGDSTSISWNFVNSFAFPSDGSVWYGTVGNGFGRSTDGGRTWRNWTFATLGPEWQYVAPDGIRAIGDTVFIATADGLRVSADGGETWRCAQAAGAPAGGASGHDDRCGERALTLPSEYLLALDARATDEGTEVWIGHLHGAAVSRDGGRTWRELGSAERLPRQRVRAIQATDSLLWIATEEGIYGGPGAGSPLRRIEEGWRDPVGPKPRAFVEGGEGAPRVLSWRGVALYQEEAYRLPQVVPPEWVPAQDAWAAIEGPGDTPLIGTATGLWQPPNQPPAPSYSASSDVARPRPPQRDWLDRPIRADEGNPHVDATYRYGSTMGGNFQQHQGVEFNNPAGTTVRAVHDGVVAFAGPAEAGALTVAILHDRGAPGRHVYTVYYHNTELLVRRGDRVRAGDPIARVGNTGRATNDHLHLEVHVTPAADSALVVNPQERFPPHTVNPQLWLRPLPGTGVVAGRVLDSRGEPVPGARIHGLVLPYPEETPFSFAETYRERAHPDPLYQEHFAVGDVPAGRYVLGVEIEGTRVWRVIEVAPGGVTFVEFARPK